MTPAEPHSGVAPENLFEVTEFGESSIRRFLYIEVYELSRESAKIDEGEYKQTRKGF